MAKQRVFVAIEIQPHLKAGLEKVKEREGMPLNFQVSKAIEKWLEDKGVLGSAKRRDAGARPRETSMRAGVYARVSTTDQHCENQLVELRRYCEARGGLSQGVCGSGRQRCEGTRPALDDLVGMRSAAGSTCWCLEAGPPRKEPAALDPAARRPQATGVAFVSLGGDRRTTPAGRLQLHVLGAIAEFERERIGSESLLAWREQKHRAST